MEHHEALAVARILDELKDGWIERTLNNHRFALGKATRELSWTVHRLAQLVEDYNTNAPIDRRIPKERTSEWT